MTPRLVRVAVVIPLAVLAMGIVRAEHRLSHGRRWVFDVNGYDPRDLLRGHYLEYRLDLPPEAPSAACIDADPACCLCLTSRGTGEPPAVEREICTTAMPRCDGVLRTDRLPDLRRYYVPEEGAAELTVRLRDAARAHRARLAVILDGQGRPQIDGLFIDGERIGK